MSLPSSLPEAETTSDGCLARVALAAFTELGSSAAQAGAWPTEMRSEQSVHLYALLSACEMRGMLKGQPFTQ